jgi:cation transport protein ChaC
MLLPPEAFTHVPALTGKIIEPETSFFRRIRERLAELDRAAQANGWPANWRLPDEVREASRNELLAGHQGDLWVFAYGSLMWDPGFHIVEIRTATLQGYHRRFCLKSEIGRGSAEKPALMAALDAEGACHGLAFRIPEASVEHETKLLWMREMLMGAYMPVLVPVDTPQGPLTAVAFLINRSSNRYVRLDLAETARLIATGRGIRGTCLEYLENLAERLDLLGLDDPDITALRLRVHRLLDPHAQPMGPDDAVGVPQAKL